MDRYYIGTYWYGRRESAEECARRTERFFQLLAKCDPVFSSWFDQGDTLEEALEHRIEPEASILSRLFLQQAQEQGHLTDEGFSLGLWNGEDNDAASSLSIYCGEGSPYVPNCCVLKTPEAGNTFERISQPSMLSQLLRAMILAWEPEWGVVTSQEHRQQVSDSRVGTFLGWLTYFSQRRGPLPPLPPPVSVEPLEDQGSLVLLTPERLSSSNASHLQLARDVAALLTPLGLLSPLRPSAP